MALIPGQMPMSKIAGNAPRTRQVSLELGAHGQLRLEFIRQIHKYLKRQKKNMKPNRAPVGLLKSERSSVSQYIHEKDFPVIIGKYF